MSNIKQSRTTKKVNDSKEFPLVQVTYLERISDAVIAESYGVHGSAPVGTPCLMVTVNNDPANRYVIPLSAIIRPKGLKEGEFIAGNFQVGSTIKFDEEGNITADSIKNVTVNALAGLVTVNSPISTFNGNVVVNGLLTLNGDGLGGTSTLKGVIDNQAAISGAGTVISNGKRLHDHIHSGVDTGPDNTGAPV